MCFYLDFCSYFETTGLSCFNVLLRMKILLLSKLSPKGRKNSYKKTDQVYLMTSLQIPSDTWKFKRKLSFLFVEEGNLFFKKSSFEEFNIIFFTAERMHGLFSNATQAAKFFAEFSGTFCTLWPRKLRV